mgnify:CR=1 FL=1
MKTKKAQRASILLVFAMIAFAVHAQTEITIVDRPAMTADGGYRTPLYGGYLKKLPVGQVQPKGWLLEILTRQKNGLNGQLGTVSDWLDKNNNQWLSDTGSHGWEEVPYWLRGYSSLAYILGDEALKAEAQVWFEGVLTHVKSNGELGPSGTDGDPQTPDLWAKMPMLWALQTYYEATGDERVLTAMTNYFRWELTIPDEHFLKGLWQSKRGGDNEWSVIWLYNQTGDESILPLIDKLHRCGVDWTMKDDLPNWHGVNVAQGFREPATYYIYNGDPAMLQAAYDNHNTMRKHYGQVPGGMYGADENARQGYFDPRQGAETCAVVEQMASDEMMMGITGDPLWADHCENVAFNTLPAALMSDMRSLRYITSPNMAISDGKNYGGSIDNGLLGMLSMSPFSSRCCQHNHGMGWPYFTEHLVMATNDGGLCTMLYSASESTLTLSDGKAVTIVEDTRYPFEEEIRLTIKAEATAAFPFYLRIPAWADGATVTVGGSTTDAVAGKYVKIERSWQNGDQVTLHLPMAITSHQWTQNKGSVSVNYGPLTLSLRIDEQYKQRDPSDPDIVQGDSHWQTGVDKSQWPAYELFAASDWNYALCVVDGEPVNIEVSRRNWPESNYPFTPEAVPLTFTAKGKKVPAWGFDDKGMTDILPTRFAERAEETETITLIPMGAARLRISAFPHADIVKSDPDCRE